MRGWGRIAGLVLVLTALWAPTVLADRFEHLGKKLGKAVDGVTNVAKDIGEAGEELLEGDPPEEQRASLQEARANALARLYGQDPDLEEVLESSKGYAVFSNVGINLLLVSTQRGGGILRDNRSEEDIYMKLFSAGGGLGFGVKDFAAIFVFHTDAAIDQFSTKGWDFSGQADAKAQYKDDGEGVETAVSAMPGTSLFQLTESGLAAQVTLQGTKFWKDEDLN